MKITLLSQAIEAGYKIADSSRQRGYVSRKPATDRAVFVAGGNRAGELYYLAPCFDSTKYCYRQYLSK